jgi:DNA-binding response OmpR family regulator
MTSPTSAGAIVIVEDSFVGHFLRVVLQRHGHRAITADAREGLDLLRPGQSQVGLLITNIPALFVPFGEWVPLLYLAACPDPALVEGFRASRALRKPFHTDELMECVRELLAGDASLAG